MIGWPASSFGFLEVTTATLEVTRVAGTACCADKRADRHGEGGVRLPGDAERARPPLLISTDETLGHVSSAFKPSSKGRSHDGSKRRRLGYGVLAGK